MNNALLHAIYGTWPTPLATLRPGAVQCSPLMVGSTALEALPDGTLASMTMLAPPSTPERRYAMAHALRALAIGSPLTVLGPKDKGGNRIAEELRSFGCTVDDVARSHFRIATTVRPAQMQDVDAALLGGALQVVEETGQWTQPGVFSWNHLDTGSALLLKHLPQLAGRGADLGCGIGTLAASVLASPSVSELTLIDLDARAVAAAKRNITDPRARFLQADVRESLPVRELDFVIMNPPFHDGGVEDKSLGQMFVTRAAELLKVGGSCWLTANRHLPYEALLSSLFRRTALVVEAEGYKIYAGMK